MYFKRLEIFGFKSFADRIVIEFQPGITCIVGPNGCGKTNVLDAIRWVLGEQSPKELRAGKMEDVIFNGSHGRKPLGMAEVSLTIDNSQNILPIQYSEVTVTRRLFRSGESEYYINKSPVRLKDITELFLDTAIGTDSYSLMEEKKINFIVNSKPEERRRIFEEVAGIMKYKWRKEEALRKLDATQANLVRLQDIIGEVKRQIGSLDYQVRKARQYQKYKEELRNLQLTSLLHRYTQLKDNLQKSEEIIRDLSSAKEEVARQYAEKERLVAELRSDLEKKDAQIVQIQKQLISILGEMARFEDRLEFRKERMAEIEAEKVRLANEIENLSKKLTFLEERTGSWEKEKELLDSQVSNLEKSLVHQTGTIQALSDRIRVLNGQLEEKKTAILEWVNRTIGLRNRILAVEAERRNLLSRKGKLESEREARLREKESIEREISEKRNQQMLKMKQKEKAEEERRVLQLEKEALLEKTKELIAELNRLQERYILKSSLQGQVATGVAEEILVKEICQQKFTGIYGTIRSLFNFPAEYRETLEKFLGERLNYVLCSDMDCALEVIKYLKQKKQGYLTFLPLKELATSNPAVKSFPGKGGVPLLDVAKYDRQYQKVAEFLFGNVFLVDNLEEIEAKRNLLRSIEDDVEAKVRETVFLTRDGDFLLSSGVVSGGSKKPLANWEQEISQLKEELTKINDARRSVEDSLSHLNQKIEAVETTLREGEVSLAQMKEAIIQKEDINKRLASEIALTIQEENTIDKELQEVEQTLKQLSVELKTSEASLQDSQEAADRIEQEIASLVRRESEEKEKAVKLQIHVTQIKERVINLAQERADLDTQKQELVTLIAQRREALTNLEEKATSLEESSTYGEKEISSLSTSKQRLEAALEKDQKEREEIRAEMEKEREICERQRLQMESLQEQITREKMNSNRLSVEMEQIQERIMRDFDLSLENAYQVVEGAVEDVGSGLDYEEEVEKLKERIEAMGNVNLAAPEEYARLKERYDFLKSQEEDLVKSSDDLKQIIAITDNEMRVNFKDKFTKVQKNFRALFTQLFEGGEADLLLTNDADLLETGVDIIAQPPGKRLQNITLLSAGEKALCAIALLFALFMVKPSPFCVLDEVDAALDDANLHRFTRLLKEFEDRAQFIVVTHNKKTMEMSDVLYGITMEEFGVSKLISVKFQKQVTV